MSNYADPAAIEWNNPNKILGHKKSLELITPFFKGKKKLSCFCLPASNWNFERRLVKTFPNIKFSITGVERNETVFQVAQDTIAKLKYKNASFNIHETDVASFFARNVAGTNYNMINLDWMGVFSMEKENDLRLVFARNHTPSYLLMLTMGIPRTSLETQTKLKQAIIQDKNPVSKNLFKSLESQGFPLKEMYIHGIPRVVYNFGKQFQKVAKFQGLIEYPSTSGQTQLVFSFIVENN